MERAYHLNILEWMWEWMTGKFETKEEILKWKYRGKIGAKSKNTFKKKEKKKNRENTDSENTLHILENGEEDTEVKEFLGGPIMIKISAEDNFFSSFLKLPGCVPIDVRVCLKKRYPHSEVEKEGSLKFFLQKCGLDTKADMPYDKMWKIYSEAKKSTSSSTARKMRERSRFYSLCILIRLTLSRKWNEGTKPSRRLCFKRDMLFSARIPEKVEKEEAVIIKKNGNTLHKISFPFNKRTIQAWCVRHDNRSEKKGLYLTVLEELFAMRLELKAQLASLGKKKDQLGKIISSVKEKGKRIPEKICGKERLSNQIWDTDSLYLTCPDKYFEKCDEALSRGELSKEEYWTEMVKITMDVIKKLRDQINAYLRIKSGTSYLKMAYEEVLFPICFAGKKKYFGIGHEEVVNFRPKTLFTKGIDTVKQGNSELFRFIREKIMWEAMGINNTRPIQKIVEDVLRDARFRQWDFNQFVAMSKWKAKGGLPCNKIFMERMRERIASREKNIKIPDSGEHFSYVVVNDGPRYKENGTKSSRKGDYMEFANIVKEQNMEINIGHYLEKTMGLCARFINDDERYQPPPSHNIMQIKDSDEREKRVDAYSQNEAKNGLKNI
ncbi:hypothetical protein C1645_835403 [Glomus cerebriforme]|uniref:DNA-directed DNA polymerase n=1 Tax=Glomus cerebriforme TaxID=658196 RepID=A0A397S7V1_9GLOM|nr:hypothetical protein C1645_835403 [Glomus cerebriforme]